MNGLKNDAFRGHALRVHSISLVQTQVIYLPDWVLGPTVLTVNLSYAHETEVCLVELILSDCSYQIDIWL